MNIEHALLLHRCYSTDRSFIKSIWLGIRINSLQLNKVQTKLQKLKAKRIWAKVIWIWIIQAYNSLHSELKLYPIDPLFHIVHSWRKIFSVLNAKLFWILAVVLQTFEICWSCKKLQTVSEFGALLCCFGVFFPSVLLGDVFC